MELQAMHTETVELRFAQASEWVMPRPLQWALGLSLGLHLGALLGVPGWLPTEPENPPLLHVTLRPAVRAEIPVVKAPAPETPARVIPEPLPATRPTSTPIKAPAHALVSKTTPLKPRTVSSSRSTSSPRRDTAAATQPAPDASVSPTVSSDTLPAIAEMLPLSPSRPGTDAVSADSHAVASRPVAPPAAATPDPVQLEAYGDTLGRLFSREQQYPRLAAMRGWEGEVVLRISIARKGKLVGIRILRSSGHDVLDRNAEALASALSPYPAPPDDLGTSELEITVPIRYHLKQAS